ncbi:hypothetical protein NDU88_007081 [Pleurodeles waltl]|uniref:Uncharacterized protein n=1 Tax=Pleurodeles waltl TaxID=8319 RepID=A0AAV7RPV2_PLEWA|nr:hypothetical protein NDU88_007081 [Pleurodeles waltl]
MRPKGPKERRDPQTRTSPAAQAKSHPPPRHDTTIDEAHKREKKRLEEGKRSPPEPTQPTRPHHATGPPATRGSPPVQPQYTQTSSQTKPKVPRTLPGNNANSEGAWPAEKPRPPPPQGEINPTSCKPAPPSCPPRRKAKRGGRHPQTWNEQHGGHPRDRQRRPHVNRPRRQNWSVPLTLPSLQVTSPTPGTHTSAREHHVQNHCNEAGKPTLPNHHGGHPKRRHNTGKPTVARTQKAKIKKKGPIRRPLPKSKEPIQFTNHHIKTHLI